jgi:hypothetical protein
MRVVRTNSVYHTKHVLVWGVWLRTSTEDPNLLRKCRCATRLLAARPQTAPSLQDDPHMRVVRPSSIYHTKHVLVWGVWLRTSTEDPNILRERRRGTPAKRATKARSFTAPAFTVQPRRPRTSHSSSRRRVGRIKVSCRPRGRTCPSGIVCPTHARCLNRQNGAAQRTLTSSRRSSARWCGQIPRSATGPSASRGVLPNGSRTVGRNPNGCRTLCGVATFCGKRATKARSFTAPALTMRPRRPRTSHPSSRRRISRVKASTWTPNGAPSL